MDAKSILLVIGQTDWEMDLQQALTFSVEERTHLSVLAVAIADPSPVGDYPVSQASLEKRRRNSETLASLIAQCQKECASAVPSFDVSSIYPDRGMAAAAFGQRALYCDFALAGASAFDDPDLRQSLMDGLLFEAGRPVFLMPHRPLSSLHPKRVLLAWDGSVVAGRAARAALDFLKSAEMVHVVMVDPERLASDEQGEPGADMACYLARHGIHVELERLASCGRPIADVLIAHAVHIHSDLIVMGAYGHWWLRERFFGGVTRTMVEQREVPVLMTR